MKLSPHIRYAVRMLFALAESPAPVPLAALAEKTGVTARAAESVHGTLKAYGITDAVTGPRGGVFLSVDLASLSLGRLVEIFDGGVAFNVCCGNRANDCPNRDGCTLRKAWSSVSAAVQRQLNSMTLEGILCADARDELEEILPALPAVSEVFQRHDSRSF